MPATSWPGCRTTHAPDGAKKTAAAPQLKDPVRCELPPAGWPFPADPLSAIPAALRAPHDHPLITHPSFVEHDTGPGHPERPDRMRAIDKALAHETFNGLLREGGAAARRRRGGDRARIRPPTLIG